MIAGPKEILALVMAFFVPALSHAQVSRLQFQHVTVEQGLTHPDVREICQDSSGFMWFGAFSGLNRFDGRAIKTIDMGTVHALCTDKYGDVWVGASDFGCISVARDTMIDYGDLGARVVVCDEDSTIWIGGDFGLFHLNPRDGRITRMGREAMADSGVNSMAMDRRGNIWLVTRSSILRFDKAALRSCLISPRKTRSHSSIAVAPDGRVWIAGGPSGQLCKIDPTTFQMVDVLENGAQVLASAVAIDGSGLVYIGTTRYGLKVYNPMTRNWATYRHSESNPQSLADDNVNGVFFDRNGNLWVGTSSGVSWVARWRKCFNRVSVRTADEESHPAEVRDIVEDHEGNLWLGTDGGLRMWDRKKGTVTAVTNTSERISSLGIVHREQLWIGMTRGNGLMHLDARLGTSDNIPRAMSLPGIDGQVTAMFEDGDTTMWLGCTHSRLYRHDLRTGRTVTFTYETPEQLVPNRVAFSGDDCPRMIYRDRQGVLWIATWFGILSLDEQSGLLNRHIHSKEGKLSFWENTWCVYEDTKGRFWVGNDLGLDLFDRSDGSFRPIIHSSQRLRGKTVVGILEDRTGALWLQTDGMLLKYNHDTDELKQYGPKDGFPITYLGSFFTIGSRASCVTSAGEFVFGIRNGIVLFRPDELWENPERPDVAITGVEVFGQSLPAAGQPIKTFVLPKQPLRLDASHNAIEFTFAGLDYAMPSQIKYAVWLDPPDHSWSNLGTQNSVRFINLSPGSYRLRVKSANGDSAWSSREASYRFEILPPWWMTWWFRSFIIVSLFSLMGFLYRRKVNRLGKEKHIQQEFSRKQIESQEAERKHLASELHDGLGQNLLVVKNEIQQFLGDRYVSKKDLHRVDSLMQESVESVREISSNLHPHHLERLGFCAAVQAMTENLSHSSGLRIECSCDKLDHQMPKEIEIHLYRIIQEALSNIVRHASAHNARVEVRDNPKSIDVIIHDDGCGFDVREFRGEQLSKHSGDVSRGFGLASMSERARIIGGTLTIESAALSGTTIRTTLPVS